MNVWAWGSSAWWSKTGVEMEWGGVWLNWRFEITGDVKRARGSLKGREMVGGWWVEMKEGK